MDQSIDACFHLCIESGKVALGSGAYYPPLSPSLKNRCLGWRCSRLVFLWFQSSVKKGDFFNVAHVGEILCCFGFVLVVGLKIELPRLLVIL